MTPDSTAFTVDSLIAAARQADLPTVAQAVLRLVAFACIVTLVVQALLVGGFYWFVRRIESGRWWR